MAQYLGIPLVPASIHNTSRILPSDTLTWRPCKVKLIFHPPVSVNEKADIDLLTAQTRPMIVDALNQPND
ncbi:MAG: 1-acyl-sn-glycerol-3-phosphate acyltransferase [Candidatus Azotimanducaceae bacterium]|jgi:1-acyl-sn-glycerol-3-phosphate acyltransferase